MSRNIRNNPQTETEGKFNKKCKDLAHRKFRARERTCLHRLVTTDATYDIFPEYMKDVSDAWAFPFENLSCPARRSRKTKPAGTVTFKFTLNDSKSGYVIAGGEHIKGDLVIPSRHETLPVTEIRFTGFLACSKLGSLVVPNTVTKIGDGAFFGCFQLSSILLPDSLTRIGIAAFYGCRHLVAIDIPHSVTEIGKGAFSGCTSLRRITINDVSLLQDADVPDGVEIVELKQDLEPSL